MTLVAPLDQKRPNFGFEEIRVIGACPNRKDQQRDQSGTQTSDPFRIEVALVARIKRPMVSIGSADEHRRFAYWREGRMAGDGLRWGDGRSIRLKTDRCHCITADLLSHSRNDLSINLARKRLP